MPQLGAQKLERVELPSSTADDPSFVVLDLNLEAGYLIDMETDNVKQATLELMTNMIKEWNYTDASGNIAEISKENVRKIGGMDFAFLDSYIQNKLESQSRQAVPSEEKKT